jgi:hypothetical protein
LLHTLSTIISIGDTGIAAHHTSILVGPVVAFVADVDQCEGIYKGAANNTETVAWKSEVKEMSRQYKI